MGFGNKAMHWTAKRMQAFLLGIFSLSLFLLVAACSEDKSPPDDGKGGKIVVLSNKMGQPCSQEIFRECAIALLRSSGLSDKEKLSLSQCNFFLAGPESSSEDLFEVARATVKAHCL